MKERGAYLISIALWGVESVLQSLLDSVREFLDLFGRAGIAYEVDLDERHDSKLARGSTGVAQRVVRVITYIRTAPRYYTS